MMLGILGTKLTAGNVGDRKKMEYTKCRIEHEHIIQKNKNKGGIKEC